MRVSSNFLAGDWAAIEVLHYRKLIWCVYSAFAVFVNSTETRASKSSRKYTYQKLLQSKPPGQWRVAWLFLTCSLWRIQPTDFPTALRAFIYPKASDISKKSNWLFYLWNPNRFGNSCQKKKSVVNWNQGKHRCTQHIVPGAISAMLG